MAKETSISTRATIVALKSPVGGKTSAEIAKITGVSVSQINRIYSKAIERGFDPDRLPFTLCDEWLQDAPRSGRPTKEARQNKEVITEPPTSQDPPPISPTPAIPQVQQPNQNPPSTSGIPVNSA
ncbi:hypothetical protein GGR50DRAFT_691876 [Xylaria sp. CBS 124048]|nr:hypothetical protein GGR50DRAFT_691876 [Xylaria sp. CBS 124048]